MQACISVDVDGHSNHMFYGCCRWHVYSYLGKNHRFVHSKQALADKGEHSKDGEAGEKNIPATGTTLSQQDTKNIIEGIMKHLTAGSPSDSIETGK